MTKETGLQTIGENELSTAAGGGNPVKDVYRRARGAYRGVQTVRRVIKKVGAFPFAIGVYQQVTRGRR